MAFPCHLFCTMFERRVYSTTAGRVNSTPDPSLYSAVHHILACKLFASNGTGQRFARKSEDAVTRGGSANCVWTA